VLPSTVTADIARAAHAASADPGKVRVGGELRGQGGFRLDGPGPLRLEHAALQRLLQETRQALDQARDRLRLTVRELEAERDREIAHRQAAEAAFAAIAAEREAEADKVRQGHAEIERLTASHALERDRLEMELEKTRNSLRTFLRHYVPRLKGFLLRR
jgi:hypothetical protein